MVSDSAVEGTPCMGAGCAGATDASAPTGDGGSIPPGPAPGDRALPDPIDCAVTTCTGSVAWELLITHDDPERSVQVEGLYSDDWGTTSLQLTAVDSGWVGDLPFRAQPRTPVPGRDDYWDDVTTATALIDADGAPLRTRDGRARIGPGGFLYTDRALDGDPPHPRTHPNIGLHEVVRSDLFETSPRSRVETRPDTSLRPVVVPDGSGAIFLHGGTQHYDLTPIDLGLGPMECGINGFDASAIGLYDSEGAVRWARCMRTMYIASLAPTPDGGAVLVGSASGDKEEPGLDTGDGAPSLHYGEVVVVRLSADGDPLWIKQLGFLQLAGSFPWRVATNDSGAVWLVSTFDTPTFDLAGQQLAATPGHTTTAFVAKFAPDGALLWARVIPQLLGEPELAVDGAGNAVVAGRYGQVPFDGNPPPVRGYRFIVKLDPSGNQAWFFDELGEGRIYMAVDHAGFVYTVAQGGPASFLYKRLLKIGP